MLDNQDMSLIKRAVAYVVTRAYLRPIGLPVLHAVQYALSIHAREVVSFDQTAERITLIRFIRDVFTRFGGQTMGVDEGYMIAMAVRKTSHLAGDIAEVGVFRGQSARVICEMKETKQLHLFDTFHGLPEPGAIDSQFKEGEYASSIASVQRFLASQANVYYYPGLFPATAAPVADKQFSFVHLDVDLYESTRSCLEFFYPRLVQNGILISHDYANAEGVRRAFDEFFSNRPELVLELTGTQCLVIKH